MADNEKQTMEQEAQDTVKEDVQPEARAGEAEGCEETAGQCSAAEADDACEEAGEQEEVSEEEIPEGAEPKSWAEKMAARKQAKQDKKSDEYKQKIAELEDKSKRQLAEFENFRRRTEKEKQAMFETGAKSVIEKILPVIDNFERGLSTMTDQERETGFASGMNMIYKQLLTELANIGVKPIEALGQEFDPNLHNAVMQVASEEYESGVVAQELLKGYTYRDTVVRHSMVAVAE